MSTVLPPEEYYNSLPRKYLGSGMLILNNQNEVLIVKPCYKEPWEIPGGIVEANEAPQETCEREVKEELGLDIKPKQLLIVDFSTRSGFKGDAIMMLFFGGILSDEQIAKIKLPDDELSEFRFVDVETAKTLVTERLVKRIPKAIEAYKKGVCLCLKDGKEL